MVVSEAESTTHRLQVLVVDDHPLVCQGLTLLLQRNPKFQVCGEAGSVAAALLMIEELAPDLVIVDLNLGNGSGLDLVKQLTAADSAIPAVVLSMHDEGMYAERALRAGALAFVNKAEPSKVLLAALDAAARGKVHVSERISDRLLQKYVRGEISSGQQPEDDLTDREMEVFQLIGKGLSTKRIARALYLSVKTIETHRAHIKDKLGVQDANQLIRVAVERTQLFAP